MSRGRRAPQSSKKLLATSQTVRDDGRRTTIHHTLLFLIIILAFRCSGQLSSGESSRFPLTMTKPAFVGGALSFKGDGKKKKISKKSRKSKHALKEGDDESRHEKDVITTSDTAAASDDDDMTEAERRALKYKLEKERKDLAKVASKSHRERVEEFNEKLGNLTEHNDIPRVSPQTSLWVQRTPFVVEPSHSLLVEFHISTGQCCRKWIMEWLNVTMTRGRKRAPFEPFAPSDIPSLDVLYCKSFL